ncbi:MAG: PAS domain S-box protein [Terrimicrobiaceae bacterium]
MTSATAAERDAAFVSRARINPLRDAVLVALVVFALFAGSASWIYFQAWKNERTHHRAVVESAAMRAAGSVDPAYLLPAGDKLLTPQQNTQARARLQAIELRASPISRITVLRPFAEGHVVLYDSDEAKKDAALSDPAQARRLADDENGLAGQVMKTAAARSVARPDGTIKAYAPIVTDSGQTIGVATAESAPHTLESGLGPIRTAGISSLVLGAVLGALSGLGVYILRKKSQLASERLARAERADRLIVEAMGQIFYEHDSVSDQIDWRGDVERITGVPAARLPLGLDWQERIHPADREAFRAARNLALVGRGHFSVEYRLRCADGHFIWLLDRGGRLSSREGRFSVIGVILDVTASREAEQRLRDVVDAAGEYIWEVDVSGRYIYTSDRVAEVLGRTPAEMLGHEPFEFVPPEDHDVIRETSTELVGRKAAFRDFEHRILRADGKVIWLSVNGVPSFDANGNWTGYRGAGLDITARKEVEQDLIREKEAANAAVRTKSQFLAMMSHEIRTPLNSVLGFADLLSDSELGPEQREHVELIQRSGDALLVLLNDILDFSRIEAAALTLDVDDIDLRDFLQEVMDLYRPAAAARKIALSLRVDPDVPDGIRTDKARLRQILLNLVGNAVKFTDHGSVEVRVRRNADTPDGRISVLVEVSDTGIGIPPDKIGLLFNPFSQVDSSSTRRFGGTGLGLAICRRLAELLGSEVGLQKSGPGGSTFFLVLNGAPAETAGPLVRPAISNAPESSRYIAKPKRVLVAEDNPVNRLLVRKMLSSFGVPSEEASNGRECVEMHAARPYDVILMDVQMPELDGLEATRAIRETEQPESPRVKIVALTADAMTGDRERCLAAGMDDYLSKPIRTEALASLLERFHLLVRDSSNSKNSAI